MSVPERFGCQPHVSCVHGATTALPCLQLPSSCRERSSLDTFRMLPIFFTAPASVSLLRTKGRTLSTFSCGPPPPPLFLVPSPLPTCQFRFLHCCVCLNKPNRVCCILANSPPSLSWLQGRAKSHHLSSGLFFLPVLLEDFQKQDACNLSFLLHVPSLHHSLSLFFYLH